MPTPRTSATGSTRGFTLLELLVVLAILVMAAALFPLALNRALPARRVTTTADHLIAAVRNAQAVSTASGRPAILTINAEGLSVGARDAGQARARWSFPASVRVTLTDAGGGAASALTVFPDGSAQAMRFDVQAGAHETVVTLSGLTGRLFVERRR